MDALLQAGPVRLRPILMTSAAMVLGMLPSAFGIGEGGEFRAPMSLATIGGLMTSTLLTLIVVPVAYLLLDRAARAHPSLAEGAVARDGQSRARDHGAAVHRARRRRTGGDPRVPQTLASAPTARRPRSPGAGPRADVRRRASARPGRQRIAEGDGSARARIGFARVRSADVIPAGG